MRSMHVWRRLDLAALAALLIGAAAFPTLASPPAATAPETGSACVKSGIATEKASSPDEIANTIAEHVQDGTEVRDAQRIALSDWCLQPRSTGSRATVATSEGAISLVSDNTDAAITDVGISYDPKANRYYAVASYSWKNNNYNDDESNDPMSPNDAVGGLDGFGVRVSGTEWDNPLSAAVVWGNPAYDGCSQNKGYVHLDATNADVDRNGHGVFYRWQDNVQIMGLCGPDGSDYDMYGGTVVYQFDLIDDCPACTPPPVCYSEVAYAQYTHTYEKFQMSADITGVVGITASAFNLNIAGEWLDADWTVRGNSAGARICPNREAGDNHPTPPTPPCNCDGDPVSLPHPSGTASVYGILSDGLLTYTAINVATGNRVKTLTSKPENSPSLTFTPKAMATLNFNTLLITSTAGRLYRVDVETVNTEFIFHPPIDLGGGWTHDLITFDGARTLYGIAGGTLRRYYIDVAKPTASQIISNGTIGTGFTLQTLTSTAPGWIMGTTSDGKLLSYKINGADSWSRYELRSSTWQVMTHLVSPGKGVFYGRLGSSAMYHYWDENPVNGSGNDLHSYNDDPVDTRGWTQILISAHPNAL